MAYYQKRNGKWRAQVRRKGVSVHGTFYTKAEAREWATAKEREIDTGKSRHRYTAALGDAFERYAEEVSPRKKGARWEVIRLKRLAKDALADIKFQNLTPEHLASWRDKRSQEVSHGSVNRELTLIRSVIKQAHRVWGWIDHNPMQHVSRLTPPPPRDRRISEDEIERLCWALGFTGEVETKQHEVAVAFLLAIETGMRLGEICGIEPEDVEGRRVRLPDTKNDQPRDVPLTQEAVRLLNLVGNRFTVRSQTASAIFYKARKRAKIEGLTFHDTRHEACTRLARKIDVLDLARMLGHRDLRSLRGYYNASAEEIAMRLDADDEPTSRPRRRTSGDGSRA